MKPLEDPFYYLNNFQTALDWVSSRYDDLLIPSEREFIRQFNGLPKASRALLVRMVMRRGELFRASRLRYAEIGPSDDAAQPLQTLGWVDTAPELSLEQLFGLLTKAEIRDCFAAQLMQPTARKAELLEQLRDQWNDRRRFEDWCNTDSEAVFALMVSDLCERFQLMFFGNLHQDWSEFVLSDLGIYRYETVAFSEASRAFQDRGDIDAYLHLHRCRQRFEADTESLPDIIGQLPEPYSDNPWLESRRAHLLFLIARHCERRDQAELALQLYAQSEHGEARIRRLRVLERSAQYSVALDLARQIERQPRNEAEDQLVRRLLPRLQRKSGLPVSPPSAAASTPRLDLRLPRPSGRHSVEEAAGSHLSRPGAPVYYVENTLINSLFGLLCWDSIFAPLPGAFFHPFHAGPADLLRADFHQRRKPLFEHCFAQLESGDYAAIIRRNFAAKHGLQSPFVYWSALDESLLEHALHCFPSAHLRLWFERLLLDIRAHRAGMPDLIQFWPAERRYRMIEVKGPGDRLQDNQRRWLEFCARHAMPVAVCHVEWQESCAMPTGDSPETCGE